MKYFVAHLLSGHAQRYHERLTRELSLQFHIAPLHERVPPHLTLKVPFDADDDQIRDVERILRSFVRTRHVTPLILKGFGHFGFKTIYLNTEKSEETVALVRDCLKTLSDNLPWLSLGHLEGNKLHASVARFLSRKQFKRVWKALGVLSPSFSTLFDNIAILKKEGTSWSVYARVALNTETPSYVPRAPLEIESVIE